MGNSSERVKWIDAAKTVAWGGGNDTACKPLVLL